MIFQIPIDSFSSLKKKKIAMSEDEKKIDSENHKKQQILCLLM